MTGYVCLGAQQVVGGSKSYKLLKRLHVWSVVYPSTFKWDKIEREFPIHEAPIRAYYLWLCFSHHSVPDYSHCCQEISLTSQCFASAVPSVSEGKLLISWSCLLWHCRKYSFAAKVLAVRSQQHWCVWAVFTNDWLHGGPACVPLEEEADVSWASGMFPPTPGLGEICLQALSVPVGGEAKSYRRQWKQEMTVYFSAVVTGWGSELQKLNKWLVEWEFLARR